MLLEGGMGPIEKMGLSSKLPEVAGGPPFALEVLVPVSVSPFPVLSFGLELLVPVPEVSPKDPVVTAKVSRDSVDALTVWVGPGPSDSLVSSGLPLSVSPFEIVPFNHFPSSGSGLRNGMELALIPEEEPAPLSCCLIDKVRGFSSKKSPGDFLKAILEYSHSVGITCDGYEGQLSAVFEAIIDSNDKKVAGPSSRTGIKGSRELNRLAYFVNYDAHSGSTSCGRCKGRAHGGIL